MVSSIVNFLVHFCIIFGSMVLFFAPFVLIFFYKHREQIIEKKPHFNQFMDKFFASKESNYLVAFWAAFEALVWFIIPEFLLFLMFFMKAKNKKNLLKYDIAGTLVGTIIGFMWHASDNTLLKIPYIFQGMIDQTRLWYDNYGIWGLAFQPFSGVPYKVFTNIAPDYHFFLLYFIIIAVFARMSRYVVAYLLTNSLYPLLHKFVRRHYAILFVLGIAIFTVLLLRVSYMYGSGYVPK